MIYNLSFLFIFFKIERIELIKDPETGRSKGYGFISVRVINFIHF